MRIFPAFTGGQLNASADVTRDYFCLEIFWFNSMNLYVRTYLCRAIFYFKGLAGCKKQEKRDQ